MKNFSYARYILKANRGSIIFGMIFISLFQFLILFLVDTFDTQLMFEAILSQLPENIKVFLNESFFKMLTFDGAAAFGFNHPMVLVLLVFIAINIPVKHIAHEIENGSMEVLLSLPVKRRWVIANLWLTGVVILFIIILASLAGSLLAIYTFHTISIGIVIKLLMICTNLWLLCVLIMSYTLLFATFGKRSNFSANLAAMFTLAFYLVFFVSQLWDAIEFTEPMNIFNYFQPQNIMMGKGSFVVDSIVLLSASIVCGLVAVWQFKRRDVP